jgi:hypothetical protein
MVGELEFVSFLHLCECPPQKKNVNVWDDKRLPRHSGSLLQGGERGGVFGITLTHISTSAGAET